MTLWSTAVWQDESELFWQTVHGTNTNPAAASQPCSQQRLVYHYLQENIIMNNLHNIPVLSTSITQALSTKTPWQPQLALCTKHACLREGWLTQSCLFATDLLCIWYKAVFNKTEEHL
jgi:hypothetical protein